MYVACITLTDDIENDEKKINEKIIKNFSKNCLSHKESKALNICLKCSDSFCDECLNLHQNHKVISKKDILNFEENLKDLNDFINNKFISIGLIEKEKEKELNIINNQELIKNLSQNISKKTEILLKGVEEIRKKETFLINKIRTELEENLPNILDYKDKIYKLLKQITENEKEIILRNDNEFIDFYLKYNKIANLSEKSKQNINNISLAIDCFRDIAGDFQYRLENIDKFIFENLETIRKYDISEDQKFYTNQIHSERTKLNPRNTVVNSLEKNPYNLNENLINLTHANSHNITFTQKKSIKFSNEINNLNIPELRSKNSNLKNNIIIGNRKFSNENIIKLNNEKNEYLSNNFNSSGGKSKLNLVNLLGSSGKSRSNLIKNINKYGYGNTLTMENKPKSNEKIGKDKDKNHNDDSNEQILFEEKEKEDFSIAPFQEKIFSFQPSTKNIYIFNKLDNQISKEEVNFDAFNFKKFETTQRSINYNNKYYITGGGFYNAKAFYELEQTNTQKLNINKLNDMLFNQPYHTLLGAKGKIFALSGFNSKKCEFFDLKNSLWNEMPDLNDSRSCPNCLIIKEYIYVFGGILENLTKSNNAIERIKINEMKCWEKFEISFTQENEISADFPFYSGIIKTSSDSILLLGGKENKNSNNLDNIYEINLQENCIKTSSEIKLPSRDEFQGKMFLKFDEGKYGQFSSLYPNKIYLYDENNKVFDVKEFK